MFCGHCGGENIRKLSLVYESGLTFVNTSSRGVGVASGGGIGIGVGRTRGSHTTATAQRAAPPQKKKYPGAVVALIITLLIVSAHLPVFLLGSLVCGVIIWQRVSFNRNTWPALYSRWDAEYLCERCGKMSVPASSVKQIKVVGQPALGDPSAPSLSSEPQ